MNRYEIKLISRSPIQTAIDLRLWIVEYKVDLLQGHTIYFEISHSHIPKQKVDELEVLRTEQVAGNR